PMQIAGQGTEIRVMFNGLPPQPQAYQLEQPSRLVLDFDKAQQNLKQNSIAVATQEASSIDVSSDAQRSRLTVNLADAGAFTTRVEGNTFILKINAAGNAVATENVAAQKSAQGISNIGFQRGGQGEGQIVIDLLGTNTPVDVQQQGSKVVV
ncbi:AMIN domain-containing protein, partial [Burkholderia stagnalis]